MLKESWKNILLGALLLTGLTMLLGSDSSDKKADPLLAMPKAEAAAMPAYEQEYMKILAQAYGEEDRSEFYSFVRSLDALKTSMKGGDKTVILSSDSPIAQIFEGK